MRVIRTIFVVFSLALALVASATAQVRVPLISLTSGAKEFADPFSAITGLFELRDRRVLVIDNEEKEIRLVDLAAGKMSVVGRQGAGPLEYRIPGMLLSGAADTAVFYDVSQQRFLLISPQGIPLRTVPFGKSGDMEGMISRMQPTAIDAAGRLYGQTLGMKLPTNKGDEVSVIAAFSDTIEIQSMDLATGKSVLRTKLRNPTAKLAPKVEMAGTKIKMTTTAPDYSPVDSWAVLPDGRVALLRDGVYRVHLIAANRTETVGPLIPSTPIPVTAIERKALLDSVRRTLDSAIAQTRKMLPTGNGAPTLDAVVLEPKTWAAQKPPFSSLQGSPDGHLWVTVTQPAGAKSTRFDVLNGSGALVAQVVLAPGERLIGLGRGTAYTVRKDSEDLQYLRQYQLPKIP
jgi:hypothetical protein